jgi:hypothetical protein
MDDTIDQSILISSATPSRLPRVDSLSDYDLKRINHSVNETGVFWTDDSMDERVLDNNLAQPQRKRIKLMKYTDPVKKKSKAPVKTIAQEVTRKIRVTATVPEEPKVIPKETQEKTEIQAPLKKASVKKMSSKKKAEITADSLFEGRVTRSRAKMQKS